MGIENFRFGDRSFKQAQKVWGLGLIFWGLEIFVLGIGYWSFKQAREGLGVEFHFFWGLRTFVLGIDIHFLGIEDFRFGD